MEKLGTLVLVSAAVLAGLIAGLFYSYSCSVNPGLGKLSDTGYLSAMQSINKEILNPVFFLSFMGTLFILPLSTWVQYDGVNTRFLLLLAASLIYAVGAFGVTIFGNVPLNEALDKISLHASSQQDLRNFRDVFEGPWNRLHSIRTLASITSFVLVTVACVIGKK